MNRTLHSQLSLHLQIIRYLHSSLFILVLKFQFFITKEKNKEPDYSNYEHKQTTNIMHDLSYNYNGFSYKNDFAVADPMHVLIWNNSAGA